MPAIKADAQLIVSNELNDSMLTKYPTRERHQRLCQSSVSSSTTQICLTDDDVGHDLKGFHCT